jgi:hypothetical protein
LWHWLEKTSFNQWTCLINGRLPPENPNSERNALVFVHRTPPLHGENPGAGQSGTGFSCTFKVKKLVGAPIEWPTTYPKGQSFDTGILPALGALKSGTGNECWQHLYQN